MTNYAYTKDIPNPPNNPSVDVPNMKTNTNSISDLIGEDHVTFEKNNGGYHNKSRYLEQGSLPTGLSTNTNAIFAKTPAQNSEPQLVMLAGNNSNVIQLTNSFNSDYSTLSTNPGWTFLPGQLNMIAGSPQGGMILNYGSAVSAGLSPNLTFDFPISFNSGVFSAQLTPFSNSFNINVVLYNLGANKLKANVYRWITSGTPRWELTDGITVYVMAIGV